MSIVRIGLSETKNFSEGYDAIFGKKGKQAKKIEGSAKTSTAKKKKKAKKKAPRKKPSS